MYYISKYLRFRRDCDVFDREANLNISNLFRTVHASACACMWHYKGDFFSSLDLIGGNTHSNILWHVILLLLM
jgi:hypothetical protein